MTRAAKHRDALDAAEAEGDEIANHINKHVGGIQLTKLTPVHVQSFYGAMERKKRSPRLRQMVHAVLHDALRQAVKWNLAVG